MDHHLRSARDLELHLKPALVTANTVILVNAAILSSGVGGSTGILYAEVRSLPPTCLPKYLSHRQAVLNLGGTEFDLLVILSV